MQASLRQNAQVSSPRYAHRVEENEKESGPYREYRSLRSLHWPRRGSLWRASSGPDGHSSPFPYPQRHIILRRSVVDTALSLSREYAGSGSVRRAVGGRPAESKCLHATLFLLVRHAVDRMWDCQLPLSCPSSRSCCSPGACQYCERRNDNTFSIEIKSKVE